MKITSGQPEPLMHTRLLRDPSALTPKEREALELFAKHSHYKRVAEVLGVKPETVRECLAAVRAKLFVKTNEAAVAAVMGEQHGNP